MKLKFNVRLAFEYGIQDGAQTTHINYEHSASAASQCHQRGFHIQREKNAYLAGFDLGKKYVGDYRAGHNLLHMAVNNGDVEPVDFKAYHSVGGGVCFDLID